MTVFIVQPSLKDHNKMQRKRLEQKNTGSIRDQTHLRVAVIVAPVACASTQRV